MNELVSKSGR